MPFSLAFRIEVVILLPSFQTKTYNEESNEEALFAILDLLKEKRNEIKLRTVMQSQWSAEYYEFQVNPRVKKGCPRYQRA